ncbi:MAG: ParB/RepB/Spo0J family partition protein [bacterium]|nr:ParB/RepB/Spo0J family partition protein [bacterium]
MSTKRRGLGRGLDALLGAEPKALDEAAPAAGVGISVDQLEPNRFQPRSAFDDAGLDELAESIRAQGVVQPIVVTPKGPDSYTIVAGERRWRAARRAGLEKVPVVVRQIDDDRQLLELALVENVQRADLNAIEEAEAYRMLGERFELSQEEIAGRVGKGRTTVTNALRLLRLPETIQDFIRDGSLTAGQARPLLAIPDPSRQIEIAERAIAEGLTARDLEALAARPKAAARARKRRKELDVHTRAAMERLTQDLQTKVEIALKKRGGTIRIHFHSEEELIRLYDRLMQRKK